MGELSTEPSDCRPYRITAGPDGSIRFNDFFSLIFWKCRLGLAPTNTSEPWENASRDAA